MKRDDENEISVHILLTGKTTKPSAAKEFYFTTTETTQTTVN